MVRGGRQSAKLVDHLRKFRKARLIAIRDAAEKILDGLGHARTAWRVLKVTPSDRAYWRSLGVQDPEQMASPSIGCQVAEAEAALGPRQYPPTLAWFAAEAAAVADRALHAISLEDMMGLDRWSEVYAAAAAGDPEAQGKLEKANQGRQRAVDAANRAKERNYASRNAKLFATYEERWKSEQRKTGCNDQEAKKRARDHIRSDKEINISSDEQLMRIIRKEERKRSGDAEN